MTPGKPLCLRLVALTLRPTMDSVIVSLLRRGAEGYVLFGGWIQFQLEGCLPDAGGWSATNVEERV